MVGKARVSYLSTFCLIRLCSFRKGIQPSYLKTKTNVIKDLTSLLKKEPVNDTVVADAAAGFRECLGEYLEHEVVDNNLEKGCRKSFFVNQR